MNKIMPTDSSLDPLHIQLLDILHKELSSTSDERNIVPYGVTGSLYVLFHVAYPQIENKMGDFVSRISWWLAPAILGIGGYFSNAPRKETALVMGSALCIQGIADYFFRGPSPSASFPKTGNSGSIVSNHLFSPKPIFDQYANAQTTPKTANSGSTIGNHVFSPKPIHDQHTEVQSPQIPFPYPNSPEKNPLSSGIQEGHNPRTVLNFSSVVSPGQKTSSSNPSLNSPPPLSRAQLLLSPVSDISNQSIGWGDSDNEFADLSFDIDRDLKDPSKSDT